MMPRFACVFALALIWPVVADAVGVYRWVDANGRVHYSDTPVTSAERVNAALLKSREVKPRPVDPVPRAFRQQVAVECELARDRVALYARAAEVFEQTATGVTYRLTPEKQQARLDELRHTQRRVCRAGAAERLWQAQQSAAAQGKPAAGLISQN